MVSRAMPWLCFPPLPCAGGLLFSRVSSLVPSLDWENTFKQTLNTPWLSDVKFGETKLRSDVSGFSLCKYFRVVHVCLANSVVGCYVFRGVSYLMLCFLMMMFETVLFSSWFVCLMAIAGTVSGLCASIFSLWLLCAAMCCLCLNLSVGSEVCLHSLIKGQAAGSSWHFYDGVLFGVLMSFNVLWLPMLEIVEKLGLHCVSFSYALLFSFLFAGVTVLSLHIPGYSCSAAACEGYFLQKICERAAAALLFA